MLVDKLSWDPELPDPLDFGQHMMITTDPPRHDRMKALVQRAFTPKRALEHAGREGFLRKSVEEILNDEPASN